MLALRKPRVALVPFGYPDYPSDLLSEMIHGSHKSLEGMGVEVVATPPVITLDDVEPARALLKQETYDALALVLVSWVEAPVLIATVRPFRDVPMILWSHTTFLQGESRVTLGALPAAGVIRETLEEMNPTVLEPPAIPSTNQVTARFVDPDTVALNCCVWVNVTEAVRGETVTVTVARTYADTNRRLMARTAADRVML